MVEAGHPQPRFELYFYSLTYPDRHWPEDKGYVGVKLWTVGQAVSLREAMHQLAERAADPKASAKALDEAYNQAMAHFTVFSTVFSTNAVTADAKNLISWGAALAAAKAKGDKPGIAKAASNASQWTTVLIPAASGINPTKATTLGLLTAITGQTDTIDKFGAQGVDQQANAVYALYNSLATSGADAPPTPRPCSTRSAPASTRRKGRRPWTRPRT